MPANATIAGSPRLRSESRVLLGRMQTERLNIRKWKTRVSLSTAILD